MSPVLPGLRPPPEERPSGGRTSGGTSGGAKRAAPPFPRRPGTRRREAPRAAPRPAPPARPALSGLSRGGTTDVLVRTSRRRALGVAGGSFAFHLLLLLALLGRLIPLPEAAPATRAAEEPEPLLYAFEAPPDLAVEEPPAADLVPLTPPAPEPAPPPEAPAPPPAAALVIPEARIAVPSTGFQNDLPFSEGDTDEFFTDAEAGEDPDAPEESEARTALPAPAEDEAPAEAEAGADDRLADALAEEAPDPAAPDPRRLAPPGDRLRFDEDAFRERIRDPAAEVRRLASDHARRNARRQAREEERRRGAPTDIWRFLDGKRFRNPEGGLVSNRNNTLYYDDRGANLVPWITRLIAEVRRNWYVPYAASYQAGHVAIAISVLRSGELAWLQVVIPSGVPGFDNAAAGALRGAQLLPLPDDYPGNDFEIMLVFWYNEQPYDLFGSSNP